MFSIFQCLHGQCPEITLIFNVSSYNFAAEIDCAMKIYNCKQYSIIQNLGTNILGNKANLSLFNSFIDTLLVTNKPAPEQFPWLLPVPIIKKPLWKFLPDVKSLFTQT